METQNLTKVYGTKEAAKDIIPYMPDQVIRESKPDAVRGFLVAAVTIAVFLPVSIRVFDKKRRQINLFTHSL